MELTRTVSERDFEKSIRRKGSFENTESLIEAGPGSGLRTASELASPK